MMIYFNGGIISPDKVKIDPTDRGFLLADGLFETMKSYQGRVFCLQEHWNRLRNGAKLLDIPLTITDTELTTIAYEILKQNNLLNTEASLRLTISRGSGPRGLLPPSEIKPTVMLTASPLSTHSTQPITLSMVTIRRNELSPLANIKSLSYLDNILAKMEAARAGATEALLLNSQGHVAEASAANIFLVTQNATLVTPRLADGALPGITRQLVIDLAQQLDISLEERIVTIADIQQAQEVFLTNSLIEIQPVSTLNNITTFKVEDNSIATRLQTHFKALIANSV